MRVLTAAEIVQVWELGQNRPGWYQALLLLASALPEHTPEEVAAFSVGHRNALLFGLREAMIGSQMDAFVECPECSESLEFGLDVGELCDGCVPETSRAPHTLEIGDTKISYRLLDSSDLAAAARGGDLDHGRETLIEQCVMSVTRDGREVGREALDEAEIAALSTEVAECDPLADKRLPLKCIACEHTWQASFDIVQFFWVELKGLAERLLEEVHVLAKAYGWPQRDILAMSSMRRRHFLNSLA